MRPRFYGISGAPFLPTFEGSPRALSWYARHFPSVPGRQERIEQEVLTRGLCLPRGADRAARTLTALQPQAPHACVSTFFTISAYMPAPASGGSPFTGWRLLGVFHEGMVRALGFGPMSPLQSVLWFLCLLRPHISEKALRTGCDPLTPFASLEYSTVVRPLLSPLLPFYPFCPLLSPRQHQKGRFLIAWDPTVRRYGHF